MLIDIDVRKYRRRGSPHERDKQFKGTETLRGRSEKFSARHRMAVKVSNEVS